MFEEIHNGEWYYGCDLQGNKGEFPKNRTEPLFQKHLKSRLNCPYHHLVAVAVKIPI